MAFSTSGGRRRPSVVATRRDAMSRSLVLVCCEVSTSTSYAASAGHGTMAITMPRAWSITGRLAIASLG